MGNALRCCCRRTQRRDEEEGPAAEGPCPEETVTPGAGVEAVDNTSEPPKSTSPVPPEAGTPPSPASPPPPGEEQDEDEGPARGSSEVQDHPGPNDRLHRSMLREMDILRRDIEDLVAEIDRLEAIIEHLLIHLDLQALEQRPPRVGPGGDQ
ncbi:eukaryotic translation initiation factor 3 subunit B-like [Ischnura elegans]|uniref:eukaryotic translation initiation factor 3 subunit B-like n=1 Tax=Ischnura elegans TaxID=197161 RepID=UPI001ED887DE|nr:eukaryotic translation initiation factor 3 subunit B-like [Ischnura elegans]XP_046393569.1 eukaryotic translation initiation factor 3 subunit B-like [Ischnura elegans]